MVISWSCFVVFSVSHRTPIQRLVPRMPKMRNTSKIITMRLPMPGSDRNTELVTYAGGEGGAVSR